MKRFATGLAALTIGGLAAGCAGAAVDIGREDLTVRDIQQAPGFDWVADSAGPFRVYAERGSAPADRIGAVLTELETEIEPRIEELLGHGIGEEPVHVFLLDSRAEMKRLIGWGGNAIAGASLGFLLTIIPDSWSGIGPHEPVHIAQARHFGRASGYGGFALSEGIAVHAARTWRGYDLHALTRHLRGIGHGLSLEELMTYQGGRSSLVTYPQAGSFARYVHERFGSAGLYAYAARQYPASEPVVREVLGVPLEELEAGWNAAVSATDTSGIDYDPTG